MMILLERRALYEIQSDREGGPLGKERIAAFYSPSGMIPKPDPAWQLQCV